jgi:hypothetical protein
MMSYTIDVAQPDTTDNRWVWNLYDRGGTRRLARGDSTDIEGALSDATNRLLIEHRTGER